jgi:hypothetical protein
MPVNVEHEREALLRRVVDVVGDHRAPVQAPQIKQKREARMESARHG